MKKPGKIPWLNVIRWNPMQPHFSLANKKNIIAYFTYLNWFILFRPACRLHSFALRSNSIYIYFLYQFHILSSIFYLFSFAVAPRIIVLHFCLSHYVKSQLSFHEIYFHSCKKKCFKDYRCYVQLSSSRFLYFVGQSVLGRS